MKMNVTADLWWKNAVLYCASVKTFLDTDGDGVGDLAGMTRRIDYLADLGVTADGDDLRRPGRARPCPAARRVGAGGGAQPGRRRDHGHPRPGRARGRADDVERLLSLLDGDVVEPVEGRATLELEGYGYRWLRVRRTGDDRIS